MCMSGLPVCVFVRSLEVELQVIVSHHVGAQNQTWVLCKNSQCSLTAEPHL